jgi:hypothetical protein
MGTASGDALTRLRRDQGSEPGPLFVPVYNWFTERFDTLDLTEARTLLHELD